ncbi:hypothetical protein H0E87_024040 [Populus deltoides]|uniref:PIG-P domain-containing protein n=1 Tax=Populus deltoides TaxID=3696 RepID=A0A8T2X741_POPDE|nr:hypothetical protein H0E87_024040 [Populus deltoides]
MQGTEDQHSVRVQGECLAFQRGGKQLYPFLILMTKLLLDLVCLEIMAPNPLKFMVLLAPLLPLLLQKEQYLSSVLNSIVFVRAVIFLVWAYVPENWFHTIGIFYYPNKYWALAGPIYAMLTILLALLFYAGLNSMSTPPPSSLNTIFDEFSKEPSTFIPSREGDEQPIEPISDNGINKIKKSHVY